jgi:hypothetical protein
MLLPYKKHASRSSTRNMKFFYNMNRHQKTALFLAPFLGLFAFIATDYYLAWKESQKPKAVTQLELTQECVLSQRPCQLVENDLQIILQSSATPGASLLTLGIEANQQLQGITIELVQNGQSLGPRDMLPLGGLKHWMADLPATTAAGYSNDPLTLRLAVTTPKKTHFAEVEIRI